MPRNLADLLNEILVLAKQASSFLVQLGPLTLSVDETVEGTPLTVRIIGATAGGVVSLIPPAGMTFDPATLTITGAPETVGEYKMILRETHPQGANSPIISTVSFTVTAKPAVPRFWTADSTAIRADGTKWTADGAVEGGMIDPPSTGRSFFSDPFFANPFFRTGA